MATRIIEWVLDGTILKMGKARLDKDTEAFVPVKEFDLKDLIAAFGEAEDLELQGFAYFAKQRLMDSGASAKGDADAKIENAGKIWDQLTIDRKWVGERTNATGAAADRKLAKKVRESAKVVSLEGLLAKKMYEPDKFTDEDQAKLDEFMAIKFGYKQPETATETN